ncbi:MAG: tetratricopeptide repeat protein [Nitrosomonadales bacterium]|nr:tetratricopeptide repeat protein [Nitrosomonadales bacterium]
MNSTGRNDPCPCGSGKKYKNCCLGKTGATQPLPAQTSKSGNAGVNATNVKSASKLLLQAIALQQAGQLDEARSIYRSLLIANPNDSDALHYLGLIAFQKEEYAEAANLIEQAVKLNGKVPGYHYNLGNTYRRLNQTEAAADAYLEAIRLDPRFLTAHVNIGNVLRETGKLEAAAKHYRIAISLKPDHVQALTHLGHTLYALCEFGAATDSYTRALKLTESQELKEGFARCIKYVSFTQDNADFRRYVMRALSEPWGRPSNFVDASLSLINPNRQIKKCIDQAVSAWPARLPEHTLFGASGLATVADDRLLACLLENVPVADIELERFLTMVRLTLLDAAATGPTPEMPEGKILAFYCALAQQCFINEYVYSCTDEELARVHTLRERLVAALTSGLAVPALWLPAVAAYFPLYSLPSAEILLNQSWPKPITALLTQQVQEPQEERQLRANITCLTRVENDVSRQVQQQYEENPYPRWVKSLHGMKALTVDEYLHAQFPSASFQPLGKTDEVDLLVAGCGTGQHPVHTAQQFRGARVLAIDLSLSSLSYAKRKTQEMGLNNIEYAQADIMKLGTIGQTFDLIESMGVLHHMADPQAGWRELTTLLRPGGFMFLGFYSELARQYIVVARDFVARQGYTGSTEDIRRFRQDVMAMNAETTEAAIRRVTLTSDFFSLSDCRDLVFHVQEHRFTLPQIKKCLAELDLEFIGFLALNPNTVKQYAARFPEDRSMSNLDSWARFETENPDTFARMYQFCVQKRG